MKMKKENLNQTNLDYIISLGYPKSEAIELIKNTTSIEKDLKLLKKAYPIQYLIGYVSFYGYNIKVNKDVLIPRPETEFLVEKTIILVKNCFFNKKIKILELGTGSGCISISLKKELPNIIIDAIDISKKALKLAENNALLNNVYINFFKSNMLKKVKTQYDVIISNPPYISKSREISYSVKKYEPKKALYAKKNGIEYYEKILKHSKKNLMKKSVIAFEIGHDQSNAIIQLAKKYFPNSKQIVEKDLFDKERYFFLINE